MMPDREKVIHGLMACGCTAGVPNICGIMECPYKHPGECIHQLARDALELLKEQKPKVLSRSEAESYSEVVDCYSEKNPLYVEYQKPHPYNLRWATNETVGAWMSDFEISRDYGIDFRFWTSRPTEEERKNVLWEEKGDD
jgi:hypothetical protein